MEKTAEMNILIDEGRKLEGFTWFAAVLVKGKIRDIQVHRKRQKIHYLDVSQSVMDFILQ
jgi:hypothetical protein